jgi:YD repeat-containing protein
LISDEIGNRILSLINGKQSDYTANNLNQYNQRTVPPFAEVLGNANAASTVTVSNSPVQRQGDLFFTQIPVDNSSAPVYSAFTVVGARTNADAQGNDAVQQGVVKKVVPQTPEAFTYDFDGNVLSDGRWNYTWDGENRLVSATSLNSAPS